LGRQGIYNLSYGALIDINGGNAKSDAHGKPFPCLKKDDFWN